LTADSVSELPPAGFRLHGQFKGIGGLFNAILAPGPDPGSQRLYASHTYDGAPFDIVAVHPDTGEIDVFTCPVATELSAYGLTEGADGKVYIGTLPKAHIMVVDWDTKKLVDFGRPSTTESYIWAMTVGSDQKIYAATYPNAKLISYDPTTRLSVDLGRMGSDDQMYAHFVAGDDSFLYIGIGPDTQCDLVAYELATGRHHSILPKGWAGGGTHVAMLYKGTDGQVYAVLKGAWRQLKGWNSTAVPGSKTPALVPIWSGWPARSGIPPLRMADGRGIFYDGRSVTLTSKNGSNITHLTGYQGKAADIFRLGLGSDDKLYGSSAEPSHFFKAEPDSKKLSDVGSPGGGEFYSFLSWKGKLIGAGYGLPSQIMTYSPGGVWHPGTTAHDNPQWVHYPTENTGERPMAMIAGPDSKVYIGAVATYAKLGGPVLVFDVETGHVNAYPNIITNQSVVALVATSLASDGVVVGGTTVAGGGGSVTTQTEAHLFIWSPTQRKLIFDMVPVPGQNTIQALAIGHSGLLYGLAGKEIGYPSNPNGRPTLFAFDLNKRQVVATSLQTQPIGDVVYNAMALSPGPTGKLYGVGARGIFVIDERKHEQVLLAPCAGITGGFAARAVPPVSTGAPSGFELFFIQSSQIVSYSVPVDSGYATPNVTKPDDDAPRRAKTDDPDPYADPVLALAIASTEQGARTGMLRDILPQTPPAHTPAKVLMNPLKGLSPLQKVHHSWPLGWEQWPAGGNVDGVLNDYVRITGAFPYALSDYSLATLNATVHICESVLQSRVAAGLPPPVVSVNWSPWYRKFNGSDPSDDGPNEKAELALYDDLLAALRRGMDVLKTQISVGAFLLDSEKFAATPANHEAVIRKHNLIFNLTIKYFPQARIEQYGRGTMCRADSWASYCAPPQQSCKVPSDPWWMRTSYTLQERGDSLAISVYTVPEIWEMRAVMTQTVALAQKHNVSGQLRGGVTPWISLGAGYRRVPNHTLTGSYVYQYWDFDRVYSWQLGAELNIPWWGSPERAAMTAPWGAAQVVCLFPSVFDPGSSQAGPGNRSTVMMQHFVNYVRGANGLDGLASGGQVQTSKTDDGDEVAPSIALLERVARAESGGPVITPGRMAPLKTDAVEEALAIHTLAAVFAAAQLTVVESQRIHYEAETVAVVGNSPKVRMDTTTVSWPATTAASAIMQPPLPSGKRWVSYWISVHDINASLAVDQLRAAGGAKAATSVMVDCGDVIRPDGTLTCRNFTGCASLIPAVQAMGIGVERLVQSTGGKIGPLRAMYSAPQPSIDALVALSKRQHLRGITWDVEPEKDSAGKSLTHADAVQYAGYLAKLRAALAWATLSFYTFIGCH
jgi:hypothetical protein